MSKAIIILLCSIVLMVIALGSMVKMILEEVSQIYGALVVKGYLKGADDECERAVEQMEYDMLYEPTYNPEDGSM